MNRKVRLSVIIIAKNEEKRIKDCLKSVSQIADEIILVDNGSEDKTIEIAQKFGVNIHQNNKSNFSDLRNFGAQKALGEWLLYIDADETVPLLLRKEIRWTIFNLPARIATQSVADGQFSIYKYSAYAIARKNILLGHEMRWGGWWPDYVIRLIKARSLKGYKGELHEQPEIEGKIGYLREHLIHNTHESLEEMVEKTNDWSEIEAKLLFDSGHPKMNVPRFLTAMFREFWYRGILKLGFFDGPIGIIEIIYQVFSRFVTYAKLWELQVQDNSKIKD